MQVIDAKDKVFKAVAHPARRDILALLSISNRTVKELTAEFAMSQPAISQHLRELRDADLVTYEKTGLERQYRLTASPLKLVFEWSSQYKRFFDPAGHAWEFAASKGAAKAIARPKRKKEERDGR